jgi:UDP-N-acetylglucosamine--N-acetylmuramyl-(pentapeptide) pyrophosphoryl-undecaprenol N-acetylglucosamine transferase
MNASENVIVLAAGGTGGHLFPAQALAEELGNRGLRVELMTDERVRDYGKSFPAAATHIVPSASVSLRNPFLFPKKSLRLLRGLLKARGILSSLRPSLVVGFGGYPSFPPLYAASMLGIPTLLHEQNAVLGRANKRLAARATRIALSFPETRGLEEALAAKSVLTGNPVREIALQHRAAPYPDLDQSGPIRMVIFGGSQGAKFFSDFMPQALVKLPPDLLRRLSIVQQCRPEDVERAREEYNQAGVTAEIATFFDNLPTRIASSHLVMCRAGASTVAELGVIGRPAIFVPLPHALDNDQLRNAQSFAAAAAGWLQPQHTLEPKSFATFLTQLLRDPAKLKASATAALLQGRPDAAKSLADLAQSIMC